MDLDSNGPKILKFTGDIIDMHGEEPRVKICTNSENRRILFSAYIYIYTYI